MQEKFSERRLFLKTLGTYAAAAAVSPFLQPNSRSEHILFASHPEHLISTNVTPAINIGQLTDQYGRRFWDIEGKMDILKSAGCKSLRVELALRGHQSWDSNALNEYEQIFKMARDRGMEVAVIVDYGMIYGTYADHNHNNAEEMGGNGKNEYMTRVVDAAEQFVTKLGGYFNRIEAWNEPAQKSVSMEQYLFPSVMAQFLTDLHTRVKSIRPDMEIVYGGAQAGEPVVYRDHVGKPVCYLEKLLDYGETTLGWTKPMFDSLGYHMYIAQGRRATAWDIGYWLDKIQRLLPGIDVRITEGGWESGDTEESLQIQADNLVTFYTEVSKPQYHVKEANWFCLADYYLDSEGGLKRFGLIDATGKLKPSLLAYMKMTGMLPATAH